MQGAWVQSLVRELNMLCGANKQTKKIPGVWQCCTPLSMIFVIFVATHSQRGICKLRVMEDYLCFGSSPWGSTEVILEKKAQQCVKCFLSKASSCDCTAGFNPSSPFYHSTFSSLFKICFLSKSPWKLKCPFSADCFSWETDKRIKRGSKLSVSFFSALPSFHLKDSFYGTKNLTAACLGVRV